MAVERRFKFNRCIHWEKGNKGKYIGFNNPLFDIDVLFIPWIKNDGNKGFIEWLIFRFGWYPVPPTDKTETSAFGRKTLKEALTRGGQ